jgi:hypothetical protein
VARTRETARRGDAVAGRSSACGTGSADDAEQPQDDDDEQNRAHNPETKHAAGFLLANVRSPATQCACQHPSGAVLEG